MAGSIQLIYLIIKKILNIINWLNLNFCNSYLLKFPLKKEENSMKETNIIYDSVSNTWSIIVKVVNKSLLQIEYPELTGYKTKEISISCFFWKVSQPQIVNNLYEPSTCSLLITELNGIA